MKSILLKLDEALLAETDKGAKESEKSRNSYIKEALMHYNTWRKRKAIEKQLQFEASLIKQNKAQWAEFKEWEKASLTDLNDHLDNLER